MKVKDELVVITGANGEIGKSLCLEFLKRGAFVAGVDFEDFEENEISNFKDHFHFFKADLVTESEYKKTSECILQHFTKKPFVWVNNSGISRIDLFETISSEEFDLIVDINIKGVIYGTRTALGVMKEPERGHIVNISSVNGKIAMPFTSADVTTKHAVDGFTKSLILEKKFTHSAIKFHLVSPGFTQEYILSQSKKFSLPNFFNSLIAKPEAIAFEIVEGILKGESEIHPTLHGKIMMQASRFSPALAKIGARVLAAKNWKESLGLDPIKKHKD